MMMMTMMMMMMMMMWLDWSNQFTSVITQDLTINPYEIHVSVAFNLPTLVMALGIVLYHLLILGFLIVSCGLVLLVSYPVIFFSVGFLVVYGRW